MRVVLRFEDRTPCHLGAVEEVRLDHEGKGLTIRPRADGGFTVFIDPASGAGLDSLWVRGQGTNMIDIQVRP